LFVERYVVTGPVTIVPFPVTRLLPPSHWLPVTTHGTHHTFTTVYTQLRYRLGYTHTRSRFTGYLRTLRWLHLWTTQICRLPFGVALRYRPVDVYACRHGYHTTYTLPFYVTNVSRLFPVNLVTLHRLGGPTVWFVSSGSRWVTLLRFIHVHSMLYSFNVIWCSCCQHGERKLFPLMLRFRCRYCFVRTRNFERYGYLPG